MKAGHKFLLGAAAIVASVGFLIAEGVKETGVYFLVSLATLNVFVNFSSGERPFIVILPESVKPFWVL